MCKLSVKLLSSGVDRCAGDIQADNRWFKQVVAEQPRNMGNSWRPYVFGTLAEV